MFDEKLAIKRRFNLQCDSRATFLQAQELSVRFNIQQRCLHKPRNVRVLSIPSARERIHEAGREITGSLIPVK